MAFLHRSAIRADEQLGTAGVVTVAAADIGVERLDLMYQPEAEQEFEGAVNGRRLGRAGARFKRFEQVIGLNRPVRFKHKLEHTATNGRQAFALFITEGFSGMQRRRCGIATHMSNI